MAANPSITYEEKPALKNATAVGLQAAAVGAFVSAIQNALDTHSRGGLGFLTRTGSTIGTFGTLLELVGSLTSLTKLCHILAAMGAAFAFTEGTVANARRTDDPINGVAGGCAAGFLAGIRGTLLSCSEFVPSN
jgi:hypothetical protein